MTDIGPHLLGRIPSPPDDRDFLLRDFIDADPFDVALAKLNASRAAKATKEWAAFITEYLKSQQPAPPTPPPTPPAPPTPTDQVWQDVENPLDQGNTGHCVGFGWAQFGNTDPVDDKYADSDGHAIYYECKVLDGEPGAEDGSYVRTGAKAMQNRKRIDAYAFAKTVDEIKTWVQKSGPVVVGTDWYNDMFNPDANNFVAPTGGVAGGHCYLLIGDLPDEGAFEFLNSWGTSWGNNGRFKMKYEDFDKLLQAQGEAVATLELS